MYLYCIMSATCFGHSCGQRQGDFIGKKNTAVIKLCLNHSAVLKIILISVKIHC